MKKYIFLLLLLPSMVWAQKKPLTHDDYDQWESLSANRISDSGNWVWYEINPQEGDGNLFLYNVENQKSVGFERGHSGSLSFDEKFLVFKVKPKYEDIREAKRKKLKDKETPKDHLVIYNLDSATFDTIENVSSYKMPSEFGGIIAIELAEYAAPKKKEKEEEKEEESVSKSEEESSSTAETEEEEKKKPKEKLKDHPVIVRALDQSVFDTIHYVKTFQFAEKAPVLVYLQEVENNDSIKGVYRFFEGKSTLVDTSGKAFSNLTVNQNGSQLAWMVTNDSAKAKKYMLRYTDGEDQVQIDSETSGLPKNWMPANANVEFDTTGQYLVLRSMPIPEEIEEDTMALDEEKVSLDIWSWTDTIIQPAQMISLSSDKNKSYSAIWHLEEKKLVQLASPSLKVRFNPNRLQTWMSAYDDREYVKSMSWDYPVARDLYLVNIESGERLLIKEKVKGSARLSPAGKYLYWYDKEAKKYWAYHIENKELLFLNHFKSPIWNVDHDAPSLPGNYGMAGWSENDSVVFIYDEFDIWKVPLKDPSKAWCFTGQNGRKNNKRYRYYDLDYETPYIPNELQYLSVFNKETKEYGFATINFFEDHKMDLGTFFYGKHTISSLTKAKDSDVIIFRKGDFENYPELYVSDLDHRPEKKISNTNPQQANYNWGTAELMEWKSKHGKLQGILYKPEDFDPNKKYPVVIYFYEKYSDLVYNHFGFRPSASTINFAYFTSNGYVVFVPDIVYKTGEPGQSAYDCIVSGTKALMKKSFIDKDRIAIQGQSWGGYQVAYLVTQTNLYACAMAGAPVSNMTSAYGGIRWGSGWSREFQYEKTQSRLGATLWNDRKAYINNSPVFFADQVETPLLIMHNDEDGAVPWYQGIEYFMALRRLNKPAWMLVYNKEAHNLRKRHNRIDLSKRMSQFFDYYLKDAPAPEWLVLGRKAIEKDVNDGMNLME